MDELKPDRLEIAFLPYKASMFDSMESVWLAAKDDPDCDAYVIPIPYYERLSDGSLGQMYYEGADYHSYVPITDWREYSISERRPDIIVIHNPYDGVNLVTTVHPDFFAERLKEFTRLLVYIPYFVSVSDDDNDIDEMHSISAGTMYADIVVVQSEKIREKYINAFTRHANDIPDLVPYLKSKFVALGSPKFDKVLNTKREAYEIPAEWKRFIDKPDGTQKKVIFYNTTVNALLRNDSKALAKLRSVLDYFKSREDAVLLWRPHPLSTSTYASLRKELLNEYFSIVDDYKNAGYGIYDDSGDLHRAIAISDAYYGDMSSVVPLFQCAGKPVMSQNMRINSTDDNVDKIRFINIYDDGTDYWFTAYYFNALFKMNKQTWEAEYIGSFPNEKALGVHLYNSISACNGKLYFTPATASEIAVYDPKKKEFGKIIIDKPKVKSKVNYLSDHKFFASVQYKKWIFFIAYRYPAFVRYDTVTGQLDYFSEWVDQLNNIITECGDGFFYHNVIVDGSRFIAASGVTNALVEFDMKNCVPKVHAVGSTGNRYSSVCFDGENYWMSPWRTGPVVKWNPETGDCIEYYTYPVGYVIDKQGFGHITYSNGYVWVFPYNAEMVLKIRPDDGKMAVADWYKTKYIRENNDTDYNDTKLMMILPTDANIMRARSVFFNRVYEYDCENETCEEKHIVFAKGIRGSLKSILKQAFIKGVNTRKAIIDNCFIENFETSITDFLDYIVPDEKNENLDELRNMKMQIFSNEDANVDGSSGKKIYSYCKQMVL